MKIRKTGEDEYHFDVTVSHADAGWKHYANRWEIVGPEGKVIATRTLLHLHVDERPFRRGLSGVHIPGSVKKVTIRAHDSAHRYGGKMKTVDLA